MGLINKICMLCLIRTRTQTHAHAHHFFFLSPKQPTSWSAYRSLVCAPPVSRLPSHEHAFARMLCTSRSSRLPSPVPSFPPHTYYSWGTPLHLQYTARVKWRVCTLAQFRRFPGNSCPISQISWKFNMLQRLVPFTHKTWS